MNRSPKTASLRALFLLATVTLCTAITATEATAGQADGAPVRVPAGASAAAARPVARQQAGEAPENAALDGWSYGARGIVSLLWEQSLNPGFGVSGFAVLPLTTDLELEGEFGFATMSSEANGLPAGRLSVFPLRGTLRVQLWRFGSAKPYAGGGVGVYLNRFSLDAAVEQELAQVGFGAAASVDPALGLHAAGGVEWQRDGLHFGVDVKYVLGDADAVSTVVDQVTQQVFRETSTIDLDGFWIAAGVRFSF